VIDQDFLAVIHETEDKTEAMVADAQTKARQLVDDARLESDRRIAEARKNAEKIIRQTLEEARRVAGDKDRQMTAATEAQTQIIRDAAKPAMEQAVKMIAERIVK
jgi:vacuolar-type H+-ATPase subunit H